MTTATKRYIRCVQKTATHVCQLVRFATSATGVNLHFSRSTVPKYPTRIPAVRHRPWFTRRLHCVTILIKKVKRTTKIIERRRVVLGATLDVWRWVEPFNRYYVCCLIMVSPLNNCLFGHPFVPLYRSHTRLYRICYAIYEQLNSDRSRRVCHLV